MVQVRLTPDLRCEGSGPVEPPVMPLEAFRADPGPYVISSDITMQVASRMLEAHKRKMAFLEGDKGIASEVTASEPQLASVNREELRGHRIAVEVLGDITTRASGTELVPYVFDVANQSLEHVTA